MAAEGCEPGAELSVAIGDDKWIRDLNRRYKGRDAATDVLAFPQSVGRHVPAVARPAGEGGAAPLLGDVAISVETAERQARAMGHPVRAELALLLIHGILHLTGWKDRTLAQRRQMMGRAEALLREIDPALACDLAPTSRSQKSGGVTDPPSRTTR